MDDYQQGMKQQVQLIQVCCGCGTMFVLPDIVVGSKPASQPLTQDEPRHQPKRGP